MVDKVVVIFLVFIEVVVSTRVGVALVIVREVEEKFETDYKKSYS